MPLTHAGRGAAEAEGAAGASSEGLAAVRFSQVCCSVTRFTCLCLAFAAPLFEPHMTEIYVQETFVLGTSAHQVFGTRRVRRSHRLRIHRCRDVHALAVETKSSATKPFMLLSVLKSFWTMRLMAEILHQRFFFETHNLRVFFILCEISRHPLYPRISSPVTWGRDFLLLALDDLWGYWNILPWLFVICKWLRSQFSTMCNPIGCTDDLFT